MNIILRKKGKLSLQHPHGGSAGKVYKKELDDDKFKLLESSQSRSK